MDQTLSIDSFIEKVLTRATFDDPSTIGEARSLFKSTALELFRSLREMGISREDTITMVKSVSILSLEATVNDMLNDAPPSDAASRPRRKRAKGTPEHLKGTPTLYPTWCLNQLQQLAGSRDRRDELIGLIENASVDPTKQHHSCVVNCNTPPWRFHRAVNCVYFLGVRAKDTRDSVNRAGNNAAFERLCDYAQETVKMIEAHIADNRVIPKDGTLSMADAVLMRLHADRFYRRLGPLGTIVPSNVRVEPRDAEGTLLVDEDQVLAEMTAVGLRPLYVAE